MFFGSYSLFIYISIFVLIYNLVKLFSKASIFRNITIFAGNIFILLTLVKEHTLIVLAILSILVFFIGKWLNKKSTKWILAISLIVIISLFSIRNYPYIQDVLSDSWLDFIKAPILSVQKIGLSYILFRYVHWLVESHKSTIHQSNFLTFINYIFFFPSILAGPIDSYKNFHYWVQNTRSEYKKALFFAGISRIFIGAIKTLLIVPLIYKSATDYTLLADNHTVFTALAISLFLYSIYIYIDFSGYSDIAIGTAYLIGIKTPENFNSPYLSINLSDFWKRWHITFSNFLSIYVFKPIINLLNLIFKTKRRLPVTVLAYLITFLICGLWHGDKINFVYWGVWHGIGLGINKVWIVEIKPKFKIIQNIPNTYMLLSALITFTYVTFGWVFFHYSHDDLFNLIQLI